MIKQINFGNLRNVILDDQIKLDYQSECFNIRSEEYI